MYVHKHSSAAALLKIVICMLYEEALQLIIAIWMHSETFASKCQQYIYVFVAYEFQNVTVLTY